MPSSPPLLISLPCLLSYHRPLQPLNTPSFFRLLSLHDHLNPLTLTASPCTPPTQSSPTNSLTLSAPLLSPRPYRPPHSAPFSREPTPTTLHRFLPLLPASPSPPLRFVDTPPPFPHQPHTLLTPISTPLPIKPKPSNLNSPPPKKKKNLLEKGQQGVSDSVGDLKARTLATKTVIRELQQNQLTSQKTKKKRMLVLRGQRVLPTAIKNSCTFPMFYIAQLELYHFLYNSIRVVG